MKTTRICVLGLLLAAAANAAPKLLPYCVNLSPAEIKALGYDGCEVPFVTGEELTKRLKAADDAQMAVGKGERDRP